MMQYTVTLTPEEYNAISNAISEEVREIYHMKPEHAAMFTKYLSALLEAREAVKRATAEWVEPENIS